MRKSIRVFWLISLLIFVSGCSGYRHYQFPVETGPKENDSAQKIIETGTMVRVTMQTGEINEGILQAIEPELVEVLLLDGGGTIQTYFVQDILKLEFYDEVSPLVHLGVASLAVGGFVVGYFMVNNDPGFRPDINDEAK